MENKLYYIEFPEIEEEFEEYKDAIDIMSRQHRLFSFLAKYLKFPDNEGYDVSFNMFQYVYKTKFKERRFILKNTNKKQ